jgi:CubicO group peptidase (beta-lactamase class C family)
MPPKKIIKRTIFVFLIAGLIYGIHYAWISFPLISGFSAKNICSCVFVEGRNQADVKKEELGDFPKSLGKATINWKDSSVTANVWGFAKRKAIYRERLGCTLVNEIPESAIRSQQFYLPGNFTPVHADSIAWPLGDRLPDTFPAGINKKQLDEAINFAFAETDSTKKVDTRAVLVLYDGKLIAEKYARGFNLHSRMLGWSIAKSFMGALIGILVNEGRLNIALPAPVPEWQDQNNPRHVITLENLLQQTSGLNFHEDYNRYSEVTNMLFNKGNMPGFTEELSLKYSPGTVFNYSSGNSNILSHIIRQTVGEKDYWAFPYTALFNKLGMYSALLEPDASGNFVGSSYIFATARDYARFGLLYYNDGVWNGERILPEGWVKKTITTPPVNRLKNYGYQFWLNGFSKKDSTKLQYPDVPPDMYYADGYGGQDIYIIPSKKLVVVRLGLHVFDENGFLKRVVAAVE